MSADKTGGPAFPKTPFVEIGTPQNGMTLRDYFAAKVMQGIIASGASGGSMSFGEIADRALMQADAMLKARDQ